MKTIPNKNGFSLIELMIVVAIIGLLVALAIPGFARYQRKSRQAEAISLLGGYHAAIIASGADVGCFVGNFVAIGFEPEGQLNYRITTTDNSATCPLPVGTPTVAACVDTSPATTALCYVAAGFPGTPHWQEKTVTTAPLTAPAQMTDHTYQATASGNFGGVNDDNWLIDQSKTLTNTVIGL